VCCDIDQYTALSSQVGDAAAILERCPACYASFLEFFCELTCSPNQAQFLTVTNVEVVNVTLSPQGTVINETLAANATLYHLSDTYAERFFNSCRDVKSASTGEVVMQMVRNATHNIQMA
jgi:Niemann-Pick C1 protein